MSIDLIGLVMVVLAVASAACIIHYWWLLMRQGPDYTQIRTKASELRRSLVALAVAEKGELQNELDVNAIMARRESRDAIEKEAIRLLCYSPEDRRKATNYLRRHNYRIKWNLPWWQRFRLNRRLYDIQPVSFDIVGRGVRVCCRTPVEFGFQRLLYEHNLHDGQQSKVGETTYFYDPALHNVGKTPD